MKADAQRQLLMWRKCKSICLYQADALIKAGTVCDALSLRLKASDTAGRVSDALSIRLKASTCLHLCPSLRLCC
jgi:hypothetical protein